MESVIVNSRPLCPSRPFFLQEFSWRAGRTLLVDNSHEFVVDARVVQPRRLTAEALAQL